MVECSSVKEPHSIQREERNVEDRARSGMRPGERYESRGRDVNQPDRT